MEEALAEELKRVLDKNPYKNMLGIEITELYEGSGRGRMKITENIVNPYGTVHGGCLYSLADIIAGTVACMRGYYVTTVSGNMNFLNPAMGTEYIECTAKEVRFGKHLAVYDVEIRDERGLILETGCFTFYVMNQRVLKS